MALISREGDSTSTTVTMECPVCEAVFADFNLVTQPGSSRVHVLCPNCRSRERNRNLWLYLKNKTPFFSQPLTVLHFAPERILAKKLKVQPNLRYVSADLCRPRAMVHADITAIPFADDAFDVILCSHVLEHVPEDRKAMRELYRVLKRGGWAAVIVPISSRYAQTFEDPSVVSPQDRERLFGQADHVRIYARDFSTRLEDAGFTVRLENYREELGPELAERYGLRKRRPELHLCMKDGRTL